MRPGRRASGVERPGPTARQELQLRVHGGLRQEQDQRPRDLLQPRAADQLQGAPKQHSRRWQSRQSSIPCVQTQEQLLLFVISLSLISTYSIRRHPILTIILLDF